MRMQFSLCLTSLTHTLNKSASMPHIYKNLMSNWNARSLTLTCIACLSISNSFVLHYMQLKYSNRCMHAFYWTCLHIQTQTHASRAHTQTHSNLYWWYVYIWLHCLHLYNVSCSSTRHTAIQSRFQIENEFSGRWSHAWLWLTYDYNEFRRQILYTEFQPSTRSFGSMHDTTQCVYIHTPHTFTTHTNTYTCSWM